MPCLLKKVVLIFLLVVTVITLSSVEADDEYQFLVVTSSGDVIVHLQDNIVQYDQENLTTEGIKHEFIGRKVNEIGQTYTSDNHVLSYQLFKYDATEYLFVQYRRNLRAYDTRNIETVKPFKPQANDSTHDHLILEKVSAQFILYDGPFGDTFLSAAIDSNGISTISENLFWEIVDVPDKYFQIMSDDRTKLNGSQPFRYKYVFKSGDYVYFLWNKQVDVTHYQSMISRLCIRDQHFRSYIESKISCQQNSYIVSATQIKSGNEHFLVIAMAGPKDDSLCTYDVTAIREYFDDTLRRCFKERDGMWPPWINGYGMSCDKISTKNEFQCGHTNDNTRILSSRTLNTSYPLYIIKGHRNQVPMVFHAYGNIINGFIGLENGHVEKVHFNQSTKVITLLYTMGVAKSPIKQLEMNENGTSLFFISAHTLGKTYVHPTYCPPRIIKVEPFNGTIKGGTLITITGEFQIPADRQAYQPLIDIFVDNEICRNVTINASSVQCFTPEVDTVGFKDITLYLQTHPRVQEPMRCNSTTTILDTFSYLEPSVNLTEQVTRQISEADCVTLTLHGNNLNIGSTRRLLVGNKLCRIITYSSNMVKCHVPRQSSNGLFPIRYVIDDSLELAAGNISYIPNPTFTDITPQHITSSGGLNIYLFGNNFEGLGPDLELHLDETSSTRCNLLDHSINESKMIHCLTPSVSIMTSVKPILRDNTCYRSRLNIPMFVVPDPVMDETDQLIFDNLQDNVTLHFEGVNLTYIRGEDVIIYIGDEKCGNVSVYETGINCSVNREILPEKLKVIARCTIGSRKYNLGTVAMIQHEEEEEEPIHPSPTTEAEQTNNHYTAIIVGIIFGAVLIIGVAIIIHRLRKKNRSDRFSVHYTNNDRVLSIERMSDNHLMDAGAIRSNDYQRTMFQRNDNTCQGSDETNYKETTPLIPQISQNIQDLLGNRNLLIPKERLVVGEIIGQGHFGHVYKGYLQSETEKAEQIVACKTLRRSNPEEMDVNAFMKEAIVMKDFHHKNVMELVGICLELNALPLVILPFMRKGDLLTYIRDIKNVPTVKQLVLFGVDVANGMDYLSQLKFVHRDLAARNCMIADDMTVKVADFGLSRDVYEKEYYTSCDKKAKLPVKWMSPESLEFGLFTPKSDVWSYGVLMWELLTRGVNPYPTVDGWDILRYLQKGRRLDKPEFCPDEMYRILQSCWAWEPDNRPTFGELTRTVPELLRKLERASERRKLMIPRLETKDKEAGNQVVKERAILEHQRSTGISKVPASGIEVEAAEIMKADDDITEQNTENNPEEQTEDMERTELMDETEGIKNTEIAEMAEGVEKTEVFEKTEGVKGTEVMEELEDKKDDTKALENNQYINQESLRR